MATGVINNNGGDSAQRNQENSGAYLACSENQAKRNNDVNDISGVSG